MQMDSLLYTASIISLIVLSKAQSVDIRCYACTTIDANAMLSEISDPNWLRWLENVKYVPFSQHCRDDFQVDLALRDGVRSQECLNGVCMKMAFRENNGASHVWRNCIPQAKEHIRADCTKISSAEGEIEVCTCNGNLCNTSNTTFSLAFFVIFLYLFLID